VHRMELVPPGLQSLLSLPTSVDHSTLPRVVYLVSELASDEDAAEVYLLNDGLNTVATRALLAAARGDCDAARDFLRTIDPRELHGAIDLVMMAEYVDSWSRDQSLPTPWFSNDKGEMVL
jgi:hypothetical protein